MTRQNDKSTPQSADTFIAIGKSKQLMCQLTTPALQQRRETVFAKLKEKVIDRKELRDGFAFKFPGTDEVLDTLTEFIKTERACCDFFVFGLSVSGDTSEAWLQLTGPEGAKDLIAAELS